jgi:hypothetical protein
MSAATSAPDDLTRKRCFNHALREAAARCPQCRRFFCRECVTEHDGRMVCAPCLRTLTRPASSKRRVASALLQCAASALGLSVACLFFYYLGRLLLSVETSFHEGTLWGP